MTFEVNSGLKTVVAVSGPSGSAIVYPPRELLFKQNAIHTIIIAEYSFSVRINDQIGPDNYQIAEEFADSRYVAGVGYTYVLNYHNTTKIEIFNTNTGIQNIESSAPTVTARVTMQGYTSPS